jgi:tRNA (mo5U34)-methyltransferase
MSVEDPLPSPGRRLAAVEAISWYHQIELPGGITTPGVFNAAGMLPNIGLPDRLDGRSVLDIGAWDGFFSFEAKRRGAARVLATDSYSWSGPGWGNKDGFLLARRLLGLDVEDLDVDVMDLDQGVVGTFDVVLFLGVLYHLKDPITALERVASVTAGQLILETESSLSWLPFPAAALFPGQELNDDPTNWWSLNRSAIAGLLRSAGFRRIECHWQAGSLQRLSRVARQLTRGHRFTPNRVVFHAFK